MSIVAAEKQIAADHPPHSPNGQAEEDAMDALRGLLLGEERARVAELATQIDELSAQFDDHDALIQRINPILGEAIRRSIHDSRDEMIDALYPIIGQLVLRAVTEAMRDLARTIDARMRRTISPSSLARRIQAQVSGVDGADVLLRDMLPFGISEVFLIHRESGLLLHHLSATTPDGDPHGEAIQDDSDIISGMLTAISEFVHDAFGTKESRRDGADLGEIQYGDASVLLETGRYAYIAVVTDGVEPSGFRAQLRQCVQAFDLANKDLLQAYDGNSANLRQIGPSLAPIQVYVQSSPAATAPSLGQPSTAKTPATPVRFGLISGLILLALVLWLLVWLVTRTV